MCLQWPVSNSPPRRHFPPRLVFFCFFRRFSGSSQICPILRQPRIGPHAPVHKDSEGPFFFVVQRGQPPLPGRWRVRRRGGPTFRPSVLTASCTARTNVPFGVWGKGVWKWTLRGGRTFSERTGDQIMCGGNLLWAKPVRGSGFPAWNPNMCVVIIFPPDSHYETKQPKAQRGKKRINFLGSKNFFEKKWTIFLSTKTRGIISLHFCLVSRFTPAPCKTHARDQIEASDWSARTFATSDEEAV